MLNLTALLNTSRAIFFDMDGTLVDSIPFHQEAWLKFLSNHGIHLRPEDFPAQNHGNIHEMIGRFFPHVTSEEKRQELGEEKETTFRKIYQPYLAEIKGLTRFLEAVKRRNISIHLSTMGDQTNINFTIDGLGIRSFFDTMTGGHEVQKGKPDPEIFLKTLQKSGVKAEQAVVFEDSGGGIRSAKSAGLKVIGMATTHTKKELLEMGCAVAFSDFEEALTALESHRFTATIPL